MLKWHRLHQPVKSLLIWLLLIGGWEAAWRSLDWKPWLFPAPSHVVDAALHLLNVPTAFGDPMSDHWPRQQAASDPDTADPHSAAENDTLIGSPLPAALLISGLRLTVGFLMSLLMGGVLGIAMWRFPSVDSLLGPLFLGLQTLPSVCWVPLAVLTFGINESGIIFVLIMGSFFAIAIALRDGLRQTPPIYKRAALMLGARRLKLYTHVLLPAAMPAAASSLRQGFSFAWRSLMGGELVFMLPRRGLGFLLTVGREFADVAQVVAVMGIMVAIGMVTDRLLFARWERRIHVRFGLI